MLEGKCPKCGYHCFGWALLEPEHQTCPECGCPLEFIYEGDVGNESEGLGRR